MSLLKRLASDTAVYGTSSILARGLNYLLTFLIATLIPTRDFGVFTDLYAMVGFALVVLTHGMETSYFRHVNLYGRDKPVFGTAFLSVAGAAALFLALCLLFLDPIAQGLRYPGQREYIAIFAAIIFFDVVSAVPFASLRQEGRAKLFAALRIGSVAVNIAGNLFFLLACPALMDSGNALGEWVSGWYRTGEEVRYVFLANLLASAVTMVLLVPSVLRHRLRMERAVYRRMLHYALPVMVMGFAGVINEMFDRKILRFLLPYDDAENLRLLGIYGFAYKVSMIMSLFLQAYRYAVEPILFSEAGNRDAPRAYARIMHYYLLAASLLFLMVVFNLPALEHFLFDRWHYNPDYRASLAIVPVLLAANGFLGIYFNVSTWYKVSDRTLYGAGIALAGAAITIGLNLALVPVFGYVGSAWATLVCYVFMTAAGLWFGQRHYYIPYDYFGLGRLLGFSALLYAAAYLARGLDWYWHTGFSALLLAGFLTAIYNRRRGA